MAQRTPVLVSGPYAQPYVTPILSSIQGELRSMIGTSLAAVADLRSINAQLSGYIPKTTLSMPDVNSIPTPGDIATKIDSTGAPTMTGDLTLHVGAAPSAPSIDTNVTLPTLNAPTVPSFNTTVNAALPEIPAVPSIHGVTLANMPVAPMFDGSRPTITMPDKPNMFTAEAPPVPVIGGPDVPPVTAFNRSNLTPMPEMQIPELSWNESMYDSALLGSLNSKLKDWVDNGGTGLPVAVEQAIFNRGRERVNAETQRLRNDVTRSWSASGWRMPASAMAAALLQAEQAAQSSNIEESRAIVIKQADLEQANRQFAFKTALDLESQIMNFTNQMRTRLFEAQKSTIQLLVETYNFYVAKRNVELELLKLETAIWETENKLIFEDIKLAWDAEQTKLDIFAKQIQSYSAQVQANATQWDSWSRAVNASLYPLDIYKTDASIYQAKIEGYRSVVAANTSVAQIEIEAQKLPLAAYASQVQGFDSHVRGISVIADTQIKAATLPIELYRAQVQGYAADASAKTDLARTAMALKQLPIEQFKSQVQAFGVLVEAEAKRVGSLVSTFATQVEAYKTKVGAEVAAVQGEVAIETYKVESAVKKVSAQLEAVKTIMAAVQGQWTAYSATAEATGKIAGNLAASAYSSVNASISDSSSVNAGDTTSDSNSTGFSSSQSTVTTYSGNA